MPSEVRSEPQQTLSVFDAVAIMVGIVVGIGIFKTPSLVAANVESEAAFIGVWVLGGFITLIGALCYAELAAAHPNTGGEYHFLSRAYGRPVAMLFGWARGSVIQTGAIAAVAFVFGDYAAQILPIGPYGPVIYAALSVVLLTGLNVLGTLESKNLQIGMTFVELGAIAAIIAFGLLYGGEPPAAPAASAAGAPALGLALILVLLTYGGWNEAAYLSGELKDAPRNIGRVLLIGTAVLVALYVLANFALLSILGLPGLRASDAVAADMMRAVAGERGAIIVSVAVVVAALSTLNATIFTGARVYYAMARDLTLLPRVGEWSERGRTPANGLLLQGGVALALIALGAASRNGFQAMVDYTAPVFWGFLLLVGLALMILRWREPGRVLPFRVPLYPLTPILFCLTCVYMLYSSLAYTGIGALIGVGVVALGTPLLFFTRADPEERAAQPRSGGIGAPAGPSSRCDPITHCFTLTSRRNLPMTSVKILATGCMTSLICLTLAAAPALAQSAAPATTAPATAAPAYEPRSGQAGKDVVWVPSPQALVDRMLDIAKLTPQDRHVDLGSGDGRTVITAAKRGANSLGIEYNPDLVALSQRAAQAEGVADKARFIQADIFQSDFSDATVLTLFLLPDLNVRLRPTILDMKPGTRVVSNTFTMAEWTADQTIDAGGQCTSYCRAHLWIVPAKVAGTWRLNDGELTLTQTFQMLSGSLTVGGKQVPLTDAKMNGAEIAFKAGDRSFTGRVDGTRMEIRSGEQTLTGTRANS